MAKKELAFTSKLLLYLLAAQDLMEPIISPYELRRRALFGGNQDSYKRTLYKWLDRGWIKFVDKNAQRFVKLTQKGQMEALLIKAKTPRPLKWDGKWRLIVFDIPEESKAKRHQLRFLLKQMDFYKLQASVYISPYPLNREAISYLQTSGLDGYIRIAKIEEMDNDKDLKKHFKIK